MNWLKEYGPLIAAMLTALGAAITAASGPAFNVTVFLTVLCTGVATALQGWAAKRPGDATQDELEAVQRAAYERGRRDSDRPPAFEPLVLDDEES